MASPGCSIIHGTWNIRPALIQDARAIAEVHTESYKSAYRGIFPEALLHDISIEKRESGWRDLLAGTEQPAPITLVGCDAAGSIAGFVAGGKERTGQLGCDAELYTIYLHPESQRKGLGELLVRRLVHDLVTCGFNSMAVWVLALNPARRFYERLGGKVIREQSTERGGQVFIDIAYGWPDLTAWYTQGP